MTRARKLTLAASLIALAVIVAFGWPTPKSYMYQGKTVEQWFEDFATGFLSDSTPPSMQKLVEMKASVAFSEMGTNAVPFLVNRITRDYEPSRFERLVYAYDSRFQSRPRKRKPSRVLQAYLAAGLLRHQVKPPDDMLASMFATALLTTNTERWTALTVAFPPLVTNSYQRANPATAPQVILSLFR